jgi:hypothetical protein
MIPLTQPTQPTQPLNQPSDLGRCLRELFAHNLPETSHNLRALVHALSGWGCVRFPQGCVRASDSAVTWGNGGCVGCVGCVRANRTRTRETVPGKGRL